MATQKETIKQQILAFKDIIDTIKETREEMDGLKKSELIELPDEKLDDIEEIANGALGKAAISGFDEVELYNREMEDYTRNPPIEPYARATYIIGRIYSDYERCRRCYDYNVKRGIDVKKDGIKHWYGIIKQEYNEIKRDIKYIRDQLNGTLKKHRPVFEELIMKGMTLEEYALHTKGNKSGEMTTYARRYYIKWAFNKKQSFINALARCYCRDMTTMNYYNGIQQEKTEYEGRAYYSIEREIVQEALRAVDNREAEYFEAMKNAYNQIYDIIKNLRNTEENK